MTIHNWIELMQTNVFVKILQTFSKCQKGAAIKRQWILHEQSIIALGCKKRCKNLRNNCLCSEWVNSSLKRVTEFVSNPSTRTVTYTQGTLNFQRAMLQCIQTNVHSGWIKEGFLRLCFYLIRYLPTWTENLNVEFLT